MQDIFEDSSSNKPEKSFRYPLYERFLWLAVVAAGVLAIIWRRRIGDFVADDPRRGYIALAAVGFFLLVALWISLRAWASRIIISPTSIKVKVIGQGYLRISWRHIQRVIYKWRLLGHKLVFVGTDGARVSFRSSIRDYYELVDFIRANAPEHVLDQLEEIFGEEDYAAEDEDEEELAHDAEPEDEDEEDDEQYPPKE